MSTQGPLFMLRVVQKVNFGYISVIYKEYNIYIYNNFFKNFFSQIIPSQMFIFTRNIQEMILLMVSMDLH